MPSPNLTSSYVWYGSSNTSAYNNWTVQYQPAPPSHPTPAPSDGYQTTASGDKYSVDENGSYHRENAPAIITVYGSEQWWFHGKLHRVGGPAVITSLGEKQWYQHHKKHREDGPAVEYPNGLKQWWLNGRQITVSTQDEFQRYLYADKYL